MSDKVQAMVIATDNYRKAMSIVKTRRKASATLFQRVLGISFVSSAYIIDLMEQSGVIGPQEGAKPRKILIDIA